MKKCIKILTLMLVLLCGICVTGNTSNAASSKTAALKAYKKLLSKSTFKWHHYNGYSTVNSSKLKFSLVYIDNNTVPELIVQNPEAAHYEGTYHIYTYRNGKVKYVGDLMDGVAYYKKTGIVRAHYGGTGGSCYYYFKLSKGKLTYKLYKNDEIEWQYDSNGDGKLSVLYYKAKSNKVGNEQKISKAKFNAALKKLIKSKKLSKPKYHKNTSTNRKKYLK